jgi:uncharacterized protein YutE (UPF0331/DUF86 family)
VTVRPEVVLARLAHLARAIAQLERLAALPATAREGEPLHQLALERALQLAAEAIFDIGHHVLAGRKLAVPAHYRDVLPALGRADVISHDLVQRLEGLAGLRNILVHDYIEVDPTHLWALIETRLGDLRAVHDALAALPELDGARG